MGYLGLCVWGCAGGIVAWALARMILLALGGGFSPRAFGLWATWTLTALAVALSYFAWNNWP